MKKIIKQILVLWFCVFSPFTVSLCSAGDTGQILNIDQSAQIVFCDLTEKNVSVHDIVGIYKGNMLITFLRVLETKSSLSKLGVIDEKQFSTSDADFKNLNIGNQAYRINTDNYEGSVDVLLAEVYKAAYENQKLQEKLRDQTVINRTVEEENMHYRKKIAEMEKTIGLLKKNLISVKGILDEKIQSYQ